MTKTVEINYVGIEDVITLVKIASELHQFGDYCSVNFTNFGWGVTVHHSKGELDEKIEFDISFDVDDENNPNPSNYERFLKASETLLERLFELKQEKGVA